MDSFKFLIAPVVAGITLIMLFFFWPFASVPAGHVGIVTLFGKVQERALEPGIAFVNPMAHVTDMTTQQWRMEAKGMEVGTRDLQTVAADVTVNAHLDARTATQVYSEYGMGYHKVLVDPVIPDRLKSVTSRFTAEELITKRDEVRQRVRLAIAEAVTERLQRQCGELRQLGERHSCRVRGGRGRNVEHALDWGLGRDEPRP